MKEEDWKEITYMVYDAPLVPLPFKKRLEVMADIVDPLKSQYVKVLEQVEVKSGK